MVYRQLALNVYYYSTLPARAKAAQERARSGVAPIMVLYYHRVADTNPNSWTISNRRFANQIRWLQRNFDLISLAEVQRRLERGHNVTPAVSITFDDGYAENCDHALPLLIRERIPVTYFVTTSNVFSGEPFPHDVRANCPLRPNTCEQIQTLSESGVVIGAHTRTHPDLGTVSDASVVEQEVLGSREDLTELLGVPVEYFAFPYGLPANLNAEAFRLARKSGILGVCSAYGGYNLPTQDPFHLRRIHADPEMIRLKNWLTVDPRKVVLSRQQEQFVRDSIPELESVGLV